MKLQLNVNVLIQHLLSWIALNMMSSALEPFKWNKEKKNGWSTSLWIDSTFDFIFFSTVMFITDAKLLCLGNRDCIHISVKHLHASAPWPANSCTCPQNQTPVSGQRSEVAYSRHCRQEGFFIWSWIPCNLTDWLYPSSHRYLRAQGRELKTQIWARFHPISLH